MNQVADVMTRGVRAMAPQDSLRLAAQAMEELQVGAVPVCEGERVVGVLTDRDITVRGVAQGLPVESTPLSAVMSRSVECVREDEPLDAVRNRMRDAQVRRLPVVDQRGSLVGMLSLGDLATKRDQDEAATAQTLAGISQPAEPDRATSSKASGKAGGGSASGKPSKRPAS